MKVEFLVRCNGCQKAHNIVTRHPNRNQSLDFVCRCGNKINATYSNKSWNVTNASPSERNDQEPVFIHEPELE